MSLNFKNNSSIKKFTSSISKDFSRKQALITGVICVCISAFIFLGSDITKIKSTSNAISNSSNIADKSNVRDTSVESKDLSKNSKNPSNTVVNNNSNSNNNSVTKNNNYSNTTESDSNKINSNTRNNINDTNKDKSDSTTSQSASTGKYKDGEYYGQSVGFKGDVKVKVVVTNGSISNVSVLENVDDADYFNRAITLTDDIVKSNSPDVSVVSGATFSSNGIINAVKNALESASN